MLRLAALSLLALGCSSSAPPPPPPLSSIPPGAVALCAGKAISAASVASAARAQGLSPRAALDALAFDARAAAAAEARGLGASPSVQQATRAAQARALLQRIRLDSESPPTDAEIDQLRSERWLDFDRPEGARVVHAVALGEHSEPARRVAEAIAAATQGASSESDFQARAAAVPHEGVEVRIESLATVARDGRVLDESNGHFDTTFSAAALDLTRPGTLSPVVATPFGYHVLYLIERTPASHPSNDEIRTLARDEIVARRGSDALRKKLAELRAREQVSVLRSADEALQLLPSLRPKR